MWVYVDSVAVGFATRFARRSVDESVEQHGDDDDDSSSSGSTTGSEPLTNFMDKQ